MGYLRRLSIAGSLLLLSTSAALAQTQRYPDSHYLVDLSTGHWCYDCTVKVIDEYKILSGYQDHTFRGDWSVSRYALAAAVARTLSLLQQREKLEAPSAPVGAERSAGVLPDHWAYPYVRKLRTENGLLDQMVAQGEFNGDQPLKRKELAYALSELLSHLEKSRGKSFRPERRQSQLAVDIESRSNYKPYIEQALNRYQFMSLYSDHTFRGDQIVTRYALSAALCRVFELFEDPATLADKN